MSTGWLVAATTQRPALCMPLPVLHGYVARAAHETAELQVAREHALSVRLLCTRKCLMTLRASQGGLYALHTKDCMHCMHCSSADDGVLT